jgi:hypothetical protein
MIEYFDFEKLCFGPCLYDAGLRQFAPFIWYPFLTLRLTMHRSLVVEHGES